MNVFAAMSQLVSMLKRLRRLQKATKTIKAIKATKATKAINAIKNTTKATKATNATEVHKSTEARQVGVYRAFCHLPWGPFCWPSPKQSCDVSKTINIITYTDV